MRLLEDAPGRWGLWLSSDEDVREDRDVVPVTNPFTGQVVAWVEQATDDDVVRAVEESAAAQSAARAQPGHVRAGWLRQAAQVIEDATPQLVDTMVRTLGKPRRAARGEARRGPALMRMCAEEIARMSGESLPLDSVPGGEGLWSMTRREPYGVAAVITPFNAPINLLLQKLAPAVATGNAVVVKPAPEAAVVTNQLVELIAPVFPQGMISVLHGGADVVTQLVGRHEVNIVSLTGGTAAGRSVHAHAGIKPVLLELGSNSPNLVLKGANLEYSAGRIAAAAFEASGQQCISAQRILVDTQVYDAFVQRFLEAAKGLVVGDPDDEETQVGPVVHERAADRVRAMVDDAVERGATVLLDGRAEDVMLGPTVLADLPPDSVLLHEEVFGPVAVLIAVGSSDEAIEVANGVAGMLQASCFTDDLETAMRVSESVRAGSVWVNEPTRFRLDVHPFGGYGTSGIGREGVRWAMEEFSQVKHIGLRRPTPA